MPFSALLAPTTANSIRARLVLRRSERRTAVASGSGGSAARRSSRWCHSRARSPTTATPTPTAMRSPHRTAIRTHATYALEMGELFAGNKLYRETMGKTNPGLLHYLATEGQRPPFMIIDCSDSRVSEQAIFSAKPGTMFTTGNIANQFHEEDLTSNAVLSYAVETLAVKHVVIMGHYGCGGIAASMVPRAALPRSLKDHPAHVAVQSWIVPIREVYEASSIPEIVEYRRRSLKNPTDELPHLHDPAFRALVEENVRANVKRIAESAVMKDHYTQRSRAASVGLLSTDVYIHGWVYDVENGEVLDLKVSVGPPGKSIPESPFPALKGRS